MHTKKKATMQGCLVLTRRVGEKVLLNHGEVTIEVVEIKGKSVRLAFLAQDKGISIRREESEKIEK